MTSRPVFALLTAGLTGVLLAVCAVPAAADPTATLTRANGNNATLEFTADRSTDTITVTLGGGATLNGPVMPRGGGSCNPTAANRFHCAFSPAVAAAAKVLVDFATMQRMPDNAGGQFTICESPCTGSSHVHGPFVIQGPAATGAPDLHVDLSGPTAGFAGQDVRYTLTVANVGAGTSAEAGVLIETLNVVGSRTTDVDEATVFADGDRLHRVSVPPLTPSGQPGSSASFEFTAGFDATPFFVFTPLDTLLTQPLGDRTLVARVFASGDPAAPGLNEDRHVTNFTLPPQGRRDSNISVARADAIRGTASGNVARVEVAVVRVSGGARAARARCSWLTKRTRFRTLPNTRRRCLQPLWLRAKGTKRWRLHLRRRLPKGSYSIYSRAVPRAGVAENRFSRRDRNKLKRRLR